MTLAIVALLILAMSAANPPASAQENTPAQSIRSLMRLLNEEMRMADFVAPMNLKEAVELLMAKYAEKGKPLSILVDAAAFSRSDGTNVYESQVTFQPSPKRLNAWTLLDIMLAQIDPGNASFIIRRGAVVITTKENAGFAHLRMQMVHSAFYNQSLSDALDDLADQVGVDITVDKRCVKEAGHPIKTIIRNSTLEDAVTLLADQADLRAVAMASGFYVTSPENAARMRRELKRKNEPVKKK